MNKGKPWLLAAGVGSFVVAALHVVIIFIGASAYRYFGAGEEMASGDEKGSLIPALITFGIAGIFFVFGMYALSGAQIVRRFLLVKPVLVVITAIFLLRGAGFFIELLGIIYNYEVPLRHAVFSFVALLIGLLYLIGTIKAWKNFS